MKITEQTFFVTGGCGFIGSNYVRFLHQKYPDVTIVNLDKLTYAGNPENLSDIEESERYHFVKGDICNKELVDELFEEYQPDVLVNFAAESHVDRSIGAPDDFIDTDVYGAYRLLEASKSHGIAKFIQISTDEVYGSIEDGEFSETDPLMPRNPYSASKAGADRLAYSYSQTYDLPVIVTRASNNFGPYQYPEKLIPLFVTNAIDGEQLPLYGDGKNVRDWLYVEDHCDAICFIIENGEDGETYNIGGGNEKQNIQITKAILNALGKDESLIKYVRDRQGHDRRYALDTEKLGSLGWQPRFRGDDGFRDAMQLTVDWYRDNENWWRPLKSGEFLEYYKSHYNMELSEQG
ncbi:MAG: dTDP-glucose 4,6-dehydratase [Candidatus Marinimicrobia bacterium]|nr:dTDP-glucose 4,6-dehydratase [Candidatus Neomarinimicrobiota bacterium]MCF7828563.1 dTDP-glucose 4,6-dehydratase [Candidatus Neomarinimicrobiota bacterium]MCF7880304.1 dTDP-glucose 4,6-dehydratase [Candidatus Neomarinimicrobiota bacterium]